MSDTIESSNGWQHIGVVMIWALDKLQGNEFQIYMAIVRKTVGYDQFLSDFVSYADIAKLTGISLRTVERIMPILIEKGFILKIATNQVANVGKLPYKYMLNTKLEGYPFVNAKKQEREHFGKKSSEKPIFLPFPTNEKEAIARHKLAIEYDKKGIKYIKEPRPEGLA